jgi:pimeloyl-ACP methyl ester carboxylesterase
LPIPLDRYRAAAILHHTTRRGIGDNSDTMFRTRFKNEIVAEFLPPSRTSKTQKLIILCDGMPSIPRKQSLGEFLAARGFWVIYPRYRETWESGGEFLAKSPHEDIVDLLDELPKELREIAFDQRFWLAPHQIFVIGGSFGGAAAILLSLERRVARVVANCPVVDWSILDQAEKTETSNPNYAEYICQAFVRCISAFECELAEASEWNLLQPLAPSKRNRWF